MSNFEKKHDCSAVNKPLRMPFIFLHKLEEIYGAELNTLSFVIVRRNEKIPAVLIDSSDSYIDLVQGIKVKKAEDFFYSSATVQYCSDDDAFVFSDRDKQSVSISRETLIENYGEEIIF